MAVPTTASLRRTRRRTPGKRWQPIKSLTIALVVSGFVYYMAPIRSHQSSSSMRIEIPSVVGAAVAAPPAEPQCPFREYPNRRYYGWNRPTQPDFLKDAEYIYGESPIMLQINDSNLPKSHGKLCVDQTEWQPTDDGPPFADGTNPSLILLDRMKNHPLYSQFKQLGAKYIATLCMTNSQCAWNDTPDEKATYGISDRPGPVTVRTLLLLLDANFRTLRETTIHLERNAPWGKKTKMEQLPDGTYLKEPRAFDDARLFLNANDQVWVSFREGKDFGWDKQVIMEIKMDWTADKWTATVAASETASFCCGRNMALMTSETGTLQSLTWADPVTVVDVNDKKHTRRLVQVVDDNHRRLKDESGRESHFHGTNAFMVPFGDNELLGMGHFHRPPGRGKNDYARFGHHYTHAFFTITAKAPHRLKRLSGEFVLPSKSNKFGDDADIIQFASGLEVDGDDVILAYGINDCEGAAVHVDKVVVNGLLRSVPEGKEVIDLMTKLK